MVKLSTPILDAILEENQNLALIFPIEIARKPKFALYFFRVMRRYPLHRTYDEELSEISPGGTVDFTYLGETGLGSGDDILRVWEERPFRILHFAFGIRPNEVWLYRAIPADVPQTGFGYQAKPAVGDKYDYIPGYLSPYDEPTVATETVLYHKLSVYIGLKNDAARPVRPSLRLLGAGYDVLPITNREFIEKMISGRIPCRFITVGGLQFFEYTVPGEWKGNEYIVDKEVVERIMSR